MNIKPFMIKVVNPMMNRLLRSPLHSIVSDRIMAIEYTGRKSGKPYSMPASRFVDNGLIYCFTEGNWWKNFIEDRNVTLILRRKRVAAYAKAMHDKDEEFIRVFRLMLKQFPGDARYHRIKLDRHKKPLAGELERIAKHSVMIKFTPRGSKEVTESHFSGY